MEENKEQTLAKVEENKEQTLAKVEENKEQTLAKVIPEKDWLMSLAPAKIEERCASITTVEKSARSDLLPLSNGVKEYSREAVEKSIMVFLIDLNLYFRESMRMSNEQIKQTAVLIYQDNYMLNYADIKIILKRFKTGEIKVFGGLDGAIICRAFAEYREQKYAEIERIQANIDDQIKSKGSVQNRLSQEEVEDFYKLVKKQLEEKKLERENEVELNKLKERAGVMLASAILKN